MSVTSPIILIGPHRSGTTWLGNALSRVPGVAYWVEPRHIWTRGFAYRQDDVLTQADATPAVCRSIRRRFQRFVEKEGAVRFAEKTPSNCLRIPFVHAVFPDAKLILVIRDGRSVLRSISEIQKAGVPSRRIVQRMMQVPIWEWPAYGFQMTEALQAKVRGRTLRYWGPRPPGWREWVEKEPCDVIRAKQWASCVRFAISGARSLPRGRVLEIRFEDLVRDADTWAGRIARFCDIADSEEFVTHITTTARPELANRWRGALDQKTLGLVRPHMEPILRELGYEW